MNEFLEVYWKNVLKFIKELCDFSTRTVATWPSNNTYFHVFVFCCLLLLIAYTHTQKHTHTLIFILFFSRLCSKWRFLFQSEAIEREREPFLSPLSFLEAVTVILSVWCVCVCVFKWGLTQNIDSIIYFYMLNTST